MHADFKNVHQLLKDEFPDLANAMLSGELAPTNPPSWKFQLGTQLLADDLYDRLRQTEFLLLQNKDWAYLKPKTFMTPATCFHVTTRSRYEKICNEKSGGLRLARNTGESSVEVMHEEKSYSDSRQYLHATSTLQKARWWAKTLKLEGELVVLKLNLAAANVDAINDPRSDLDDMILETTYFPLEHIEVALEFDSNDEDDIEEE